MTKRALVPLMIGLSFTQNAHAWRLGEPISKFIEDAAKDIETAAQNAGKALADVVTAGEEGRRRDKREAEQAQEIARLQREHAARLRHERMTKLELEIGTGKKLVTILQSQESSFNGLKQFLEHSLRTTGLLVRKLSEREIELSTFQDLIALQQADLAAWTSHLGNAENIELAAVREEIALVQWQIREKFTQYAEQLDRIPRISVEPAEVPLVDDALTAGFEALAVVNREVAKIQATLQSERESLSSREIQLAELKSDANPSEQQKGVNQ